MAVKVGINGFGRIGRVVFRTCLQNPEIQVTAINDPAIDAEYVCYLIKFDSTHGKFKGTVIQTDVGIKVDDKLIKVFHEKLPATVPWQTAGVQYVVEGSGMFTCLEKASGHLASDSVKRVIITAPSVDAPMIILGVNDNKLSPRQKVISCASSTLYCLAPIIKVLEDKYGVSEGFITSIHAMTPSLKPLDGLCLRGKHWRDHRSIHQNIIPATTGACKALGKIIPSVKDRMTGLAFRVPIVNVSVLDISVRLETNTTLQEIFKTVERVGKSDMKNIIKICSDQAVSSDFLGDSHSCILDAESSLQLKPDYFKIICWYENEYSYACRIIDSIFFSEKQFNQREQLPSNITFVRSRPSRKQEHARKEISLKCTCNSEINTKLHCSTSQDTGFNTKPTSRPFILRKPISLQTSHVVSSSNCETKKRNELFRIWNDSIDVKNTAARQNRGSFFHTSITAEPEKAEHADCIKAQERLENVKKEFSKMVSITEDLLRKSGSNKFKFSSLATASKEDIDSANIDLDTSSFDQSVYGTVDNNSTQISNPILDVCSGDCKSSFGITNIEVEQNSQSEMTTASNPFERKDIMPQYVLLKTDTHVIPKNRDISYINISPNAYIRNESEKTGVLSYEPPEDNTQISDSNLNFKEQVAKTITTLIDGLSQNIQEHHDLSYDASVPIPDISNDVKIKELVADEVVMQIIDTNEKATTEKKSCVTQTTEIKKAYADKDAVDEIHERYNLKDLVQYLQSENYNMRIIDEELKKRNIILVNSQQYDMNSEILNGIGSEGLTVEREDCYTDADLKQRILEGYNRLAPEPVIMIREATSGYDSPGNTTTISNAGSKRHEQDIYDKLDSTSGTDSNDSFEIKKRKSQVIHITDLTNSIEDLVRLDKICKIIEISDELSDKLFSALDNNDNDDNNEQLLKKKKWSFKHFCDKINLDDFCNKVFGKTV